MLPLPVWAQVLALWCLTNAVVVVAIYPTILVDDRQHRPLLHLTVLAVLRVFVVLTFGSFVVLFVAVAEGRERAAMRRHLNGRHSSVRR